MSDVNKLDNKQCPFDLDKYQMKIDNLAPEGSLPWAIIQVYMGKTVTRSEWEKPDEYIALTVKSPDSASHIDKHNKYGLSNWQPTPGDLMACDWSLLKSEPKPKPEDCMLSFDLKIGDDNDGNYQYWGYFGEADWITTQKCFGSLIKMETNNIGISGIQQIMNEIPIDTKNIMTLYLGLFIDKGADPAVSKLLAKNLYVTVDNETYDLGIYSLPPDLYGSNTRLVSYYYDLSPSNPDRTKLGTLLQQSVGKTLHFCFNWK
ncbi:MW1434 family type I TA system toxin [Xenorhabdus sp. SGI246]|uniref:Thoeris anti-defense Tad2 family protein n=1 Tax=Xenorhabdus sp. SGI246 TaxID=3158263 RepID=UPI00349F3DFB